MMSLSFPRKVSAHVCNAQEQLVLALRSVLSSGGRREANQVKEKQTEDAGKCMKKYGEGGVNGRILSDRLFLFKYT